MPHLAAVSCTRRRLERLLHTERAVTLGQTFSILATASLAFACAPLRAPAARTSQAPAAEPYVTIVPQVSVSDNAKPPPEPKPQLEADNDVMAEILALPPGSGAR